MFLLFGTRGEQTLLFVVRFVCSYCGVDGPQRVIRQRTRFTLFFIPLFSFGTKRFVRCMHCSYETALSDDQVEQARARAIGPAAA